jgi:hypothetical protein
MRLGWMLAHNQSHMIAGRRSYRLGEDLILRASVQTLD